MTRDTRTSDIGHRTLRLRSGQTSNEERRRRWAAFTFIELIVAIALTVVLLRGMYTIFFAATSLTRLSEEKSVVLLEGVAVFDYLATDLARSPYTGTQYFKTGATELVFQACPREGSAGSDVYIRYHYDGGAKRLIRGVYTTSACSVAFDDDNDGDADNDINMIIGRNVEAPFDVQYYDDTCSDTTGAGKQGVADGRVRAVKLQMTLQSRPVDSGIPDDAPFAMAFTQMIPILYQ